MARTIQKKNNFNHGMTTKELVERTDLDIFNKSAEKLLNMTPIIYGGLRSRRGTEFCDTLALRLNAVLNGTASSTVIDDLGYLQSAATVVQSGAIGTTQELFVIDYEKETNGATFEIKNIKLDYEQPIVTTELIWATNPIHGNKYVSATYFYVGNPGRGYRASDNISNVITSVTVNELGQVTALSPVKINGAVSGGISLGRAGSPRVEILEVQVSNDKATWDTAAQITITEENQSFTVGTIKSFRYVRLYRKSAETLATSFSIESFTAQSGSEGTVEQVNRVKMFRYVYSGDLKYLIVMTNKNIFIYRGGRLVQQMHITILTEDILRTIKMAAKDDTIIFTHPDMRPQRLLRTGNDNFSFGEFPLKNIPTFDFNGRITETKTKSITPSDTEGSVILTGSGFTEDMVGQYIDGGGGYCKIMEYISATQLRVQTIIPFYTTSAFSSWEYIHGFEPVWSDTRGWPRSCAFVQQRLVFGGSRDMPNSVWLSRVGDYNNFINLGNYDNDAIDWPMLTNSAITNMIVQRNLHIFTTDGEYTVPENAITPKEFRTPQMSANGSLPEVSPVIYENGILNVERNGQSLYYYGYDDTLQGYGAQNISLYFRYSGNPVCMSLEKNSVKDKGDFLFVVMDDGKMFVQALGLGENINAPCIFETNAGKILSVCAIDDEVYLAVLRGIDVFIERISDVLMDAVMSRPVSDGKIVNLESFAGARVGIEQNGRTIFKTVSTTGEITVSTLKDGIVKVGLPFRYEVKSNPIAINGRTTSIRKRINRATVECVDTPRIQLNEQILEGEDTYDFFAVGEYERDCRYMIAGEYTPVRILSVQLDVSYEG